MNMNRDINSFLITQSLMRKENDNVMNEVNMDKILIKSEPFLKNPFKCKICGKVSDRLSSFVLHQRTHLDDRPLTCKVCQKTFIDMSSLKLHILAENHIKSLESKKDYVPKSKDSFSEPQKEIINRSVYNCQICYETCNDKSALNYHLLQHELFTNSSRKKSFKDNHIATSDATAKSNFQDGRVSIKKSLNELDSSNVNTFINKVISPIDTETFLCNFCQLNFNDKNSLTNHFCLKKDKSTVLKAQIMEVNPKTKPLALKEHLKKSKTAEVFQCNKCQKIFVSSNSLSLHFCCSAQLKTYNRARKLLKCNTSKETDEKKSHSNEYNVHSEELICDVCEQHFKSKSDLNFHLKCHLADKYICEDCQTAFDDMRALKFHRRSIQRKEFVCKICKEIFCCSRNLIHHSKIHGDTKSFSCNICAMSFLKKFNLYLHYFSHSTNLPIFICSICLTTFGTRNNWVSHYCTHIGMKPLLCEVCNKLFIKKKSLYLHCRIHTDEKPYTCEICKKTFKYLNSLVMHQRTHSKKLPY